MIHPEATERNQKISIPIQRVQETVIRKRKRRWVYYFLCILLSFICSRIILVIFSIANLDLKHRVIKQVSYNSNDPKKIFLEAHHCDAFSPLNAQIFEGVISLYSITGSNTRDLMAEIHIPHVEVEKYKNLQFKGAIEWKAISPKVIYDWYKNQKDISVDFSGNACFRFCYIRFLKSHSQELYRGNLVEELLKESKTNDKEGLPMHIRNVTTANKGTSLQVDVELEIVKMGIPKFLHIHTNDIKVNFGGDFPLQVTILNQYVKSGEIRNSVAFRIQILKSNFYMYRSALWKYMNGRDLFWVLNTLRIHNDKNKDWDTYSINLRDKIVKKGNNTLKKEDAKKKVECKKQPFFVFKDIRTELNTIHGAVDIDTNLFPYISKTTSFRFISCKKCFVLKAENHLLARLKVDLEDGKEFIKLRFSIEIIDLTKIIRCLYLEKIPFTICEAESNGFFAGLSLVWDGKNLIFNTERNHKILNPPKENSSSKDTYELNHHVDSINDEILICSDISLKPKANENNSIIAYLNLPRMQIKLNSDSFNGNLTIPPMDLEVYNEGFKSTLRTECRLKLDESLKCKKDLIELLKREKFTLSILNSASYTFEPKEYLDIEKLEDKKEISGDKGENLIDQKEISISCTDVISLDPPRVGFRIKNMYLPPEKDKNESIIKNKFTISKGHYLKFLLSGAENIRNDHIVLVDDLVLEYNIINDKPKIFIHDCHLGIALFSPQEVRTLLTDKIQFGHTKNVLTNIAASQINSIFDGDDKNSTCHQIMSNLKVNVNINSDDFGENLKTNLKLRFGVKNDVLKSFKFGALNIFPVEIAYHDSENKNLCRLRLSNGSDTEYSFLLIDVAFTKKLWTGDDSGILSVYKGKSTKSINIKKKKYLEIVRSFFHQMHVKEKIENHDKQVLTNLTFNAFDSKIDFDEFIKIGDLIMCVENYGLRDLIRYKATSLLGMLFDCVPNKLILNINSDKLDLFALNIVPSKYETTFNQQAMTTLYNLRCEQEFEMLYGKGKFELLRDAELNAIMNDVILKVDKKEKIVNIDKDKHINPIPSEIQLDQGKYAPHELLYGGMNKYALVFRFNVVCQIKKDSLIEIYNVNNKMALFDSLTDLTKDDTLTCTPPSSGIALESSCTALSLFLGLNLNICLPKDLEIIGKCDDNIFLNEKLVYLINNDGYFRFSWKKMTNLTSFEGVFKIVSLKKNFKVCLKQYEKEFEVEISPRWDLLSLLFSKLKDGSAALSKNVASFAKKLSESEFGAKFLSPIVRSLQME